MRHKYPNIGDEVNILRDYFTNHVGLSGIVVDKDPPFVSVKLPNGRVFELPGRLDDVYDGLGPYISLDAAEADTDKFV